MLLDCGGGSCSGGSLTGGYKVIEKEHGVASQSDYPYSAHEGKKNKSILLRLKISNEKSQVIYKYFVVFRTLPI